LTEISEWVYVRVRILIYPHTPTSNATHKDTIHSRATLSLGVHRIDNRMLSDTGHSMGFCRYRSCFLYTSFCSYLFFSIISIYFT